MKEPQLADVCGERIDVAQVRTMASPQYRPVIP